MSVSTADDRNWIVRILGEEFGPLDWNGVVELVVIQQLGPDDELRFGTAPWQRAGDVVGLFDQARIAEPADDAEHVTQWYVQVDSRQVGPMSWAKLKSLTENGRLLPSRRVREGRTRDWVRAGTLPGLFADLTKSRSITGQAASLARPTPPPRPRPKAHSGDRHPVAALNRTTGAPEKCTRPDFVPEFKLTPLAPIVVPAATPAAINSSPASQPAAAPSWSVPPRAPAPRFTPPSPRRRNATNSTGVLDAIPVKLVGVVAATAVIGSIAWFGMGRIGTLGQNPNTEDFWKLAQIWQQVIELQEVGGAKDRWTELAAQATPVIDELQSRAADQFGSGGDQPLAKHILSMVDTEAGPTHAQGLLRRIIKEGTQAKPADIASAGSVIRDAAELVHGS